MNKTTKSILAAIPLVVGLSGPATAALSETTDAGTKNETSVAIENLLNHFSGLIPGDHDAARTMSHSRQISAFTGAAAPMSSYYTGQGSEQIVSGTGSSVNEPYSGGRWGSGGADAGPPSAGLTSVVQLAPESLGAVAADISSYTSDGTPANQAAGTQPINGNGSLTTTIIPGTNGNGSLTTTIIPGTNGNGSLTTTIIPADSTPVPLPAAVVLFGSGLAALAPLRKRTRTTLLQES